MPTREPGAIWRAITGGNALARVGVVVLFIGVAFLVKYASEHVTIPIGVRLAGVALGGIALLALGFRLRSSRAGYAMSLQGAGVGVLYLTVFAALRLYQLLPPLAAFTLLFWIAALSSYLAVRQDSMALAILGIVGGFAAPVLTSSGGGSHVMLFSYYAVLNAAIFAIAWFKAWRLLNVVGFICTFLVGTLWGVTRYRPEDFATTEPFLVLFFLFYVGIATFYAMRRSVEVRRYVDATLVFGTPLVAAGLTPYQALRTGTVNVAKFLGEEGRSGVVRQGARADLILVDGNPLQDISNTLRISGVVVNGRWIGAEERNSMLATLATP